MLHKVAILIPTYKRSSSLLRLLKSIEKLESSNSYTVIVADNDFYQQESFNMINKIKSDFNFHVDIIVVENKNISLVRNMLLTLAFEKYHCDAVAMIDDDEVVSSRWLDTLIKCQIQTDADVIQGNTQPIFLDKKRKWMEKVSFYYRDLLLSNTEEINVSTCNVFIVRRVYESMKDQLFDLSFGLIGGEDTDFFHRAKRMGISYFYCSDALAYEFYDKKRANIIWVLKRSFRVGRTNYRIFSNNNPAKLWSTIFILPFTIVRLGIFFWYPKLYIHYLIKMFRQIGIIFEGVRYSLNHR
ncbi:glycosyltransferase family 2 protein [Vibrio spartinae]|uniref:Putative glycosyl transferase n=1 Tax=Vibrio spartinae TaxID=1918945 RepID=A0A1N6M8Q8_9VIBR|nr:glycosyltransferase [Vibrio spartinae]SIO95737.1 putative glycosyl transferase [Vibrio spartinae]